MRILQTFSSTNPRQGGPVEVMKQIGKELVREGHEIEVASLDSPKDPWVKDFPFKIYALGPSTLKYSYSKRYVPWMKKNAPSYECVLVHGLWQYQGLGTWLALRKSSTPYFVYPHGMLDPYFARAHPLKHLKKQLYWFLAENKVLRDARAVLFTCEEERRLARTTFRPYKIREEVGKCCVGEPPGNPEEQRSVFLDRFPRLRGKRLLLFLGRLHPKKGCDRLIEAFSKIADSDNSLHLVMAGPDETGWRGQLEKKAEQLGVTGRITWTGMLEGDLKWGAYRSSEAFLLPSHQENFGITIVESLSCGTPVLISNKVNIWREIQEGGGGFVDDDSLEGTTKLLEGWLNLSQEERKIMREKARNCFQEKFDLRDAAQDLLKVLRSQGVDD